MIPVSREGLAELADKQRQLMLSRGEYGEADWYQRYAEIQRWAALREPKWSGSRYFFTSED